jgi:hypothetical protein
MAKAAGAEAVRNSGGPKEAIEVRGTAIPYP